MDLESAFPRLRFSQWAITSEAALTYNCVAWAAGEDDRFWWPDAVEDYYWPPAVPRAETIEAFVAAFESLGYTRCADGSVEPEAEKVAIYTNPVGVPKHAARQLPDGGWTSKLGPDVDIRHHNPQAVAGAIYGMPTVFLRRPRVSSR